MGRIYVRLGLVLVGAIAASTCSETLAQGNRPAIFTGDPNHGTVSDSMASYGPPSPYATFTSDSSDQTSLAQQVAELRAWKEKVLAKEAEAKKKAALAPSVKVGGRIHWDFASFSQNDTSIGQAGDFINGSESRRARLHARGTAFDVVDYKAQFDFATSTVTYQDVYITINELPLLGSVRVGNFYETFALEPQTSDNYITFMERSLIAKGGAVGSRHLGVAVRNYNQTETMTWGIGAFLTEQPGDPPGFPGDSFRDDKGGTALSMRSTLLPWYDEGSGGRGLLHVGASYSYRDVAEVTQGNQYRVRQRPECHLANYIVETPWLNDVQNINALGGEGAFVYGPLSIQSEFLGVFIDRTDNADPFFHGAYVFASYFLTGEHRPYKRTTGTFSRVKPYENFFRVRTENQGVQTALGAWEVGYRWSYIDLNDAGVQGGIVNDHTIGLNWYLNAHTRVMFNYVHSATRNHRGFAGTGLADIFQMRAQIDF